MACSSAIRFLNVCYDSIYAFHTHLVVGIAVKNAKHSVVVLVLTWEVLILMVFLLWYR